MLLLGLDLETSGLDPEKDRVLEVGLAHWDVERRRAIRQMDTLVKPEIEIPEERWRELEPIHGIRREDVEKYGREESEVCRMTTAWGAQADVIVAHNGTNFDKLFVQAWQKRKGLPVNGWLWIDTRLDVPEPLTGSLICIAAKYGFLNPFPHQALSDVLTMLKILDGFDIPKVIERARIPNVTVAAFGLPFERKDEAKNRGYYWSGDPIKQWRKAMKACDVEKERAECGFRIGEVKE